jgi:hypothetical protein
MSGADWALVWIAGAGAVGGALNAFATDNRSLWPSYVTHTAGSRLFRPGLAVNAAIGMALSALVFWAVGIACVRATSMGGAAVVAVIMGLLLGSLAARSITSEADKRLLHAAVCKAAAAPAADAATIRVIELALPHAVLKTATALEPRRAHRR